MAANIRKIRARRALTASGKARITRPARRRRTSPRDYPPTADKPAAPSATTDLLTRLGSHGPRPAKQPQADHKHPKNGVTGSQRDQRQCQTPAPY
jgi:hypothetical protein